MNGLLLIMLVVGMLAFLPWIAFWAVAVLFGVVIPMTWKTWLAAWALLLIVGGLGASK